MVVMALPIDTANIVNKHFELNGTDAGSHSTTQHTNAAYSLNTVGIDAEWSNGC